MMQSWYILAVIEHLPYGILARVMLSVFNILPTLLLLLYPCGCFQKCLTCCGIKSVTLHTFMDALQGCYRYQPRDCRYFAGIYLCHCVRILFLATLAIASDTAFLSMAASYSIDCPVLSVVTLHACAAGVM